MECTCICDVTVIDLARAYLSLTLWLILGFIFFDSLQQTNILQERASPSYTSPDFPASLKQFLEFEVSSLKVYLTYLDQVKEDRRFPKKSAFLGKFEAGLFLSFPHFRNIGIAVI